MIDYLKKFERIIIISLMVMLALVLSLYTIDLGLIVVKAILSPPIFLLDISELLDIFGFFMLVLIGIELLESVKTYLSKNVIPVEVVFTVALIAVARKIIILEVKEISGFTLLGLASIVIALSAGYYLLKRSR
jgi:uncharacterized membrane protein (DUF373 family)